MRRPGRKFLFDLALAQGKGVRELLTGVGGMLSPELSEWKAYERLEPFGEQRADWRAAQISRAVAEASERFDPDKLPDTKEFLLRWKIEGGDDAPPAQSAGNQIEALERAEAARKWAEKP